jgi:hypothetical protein
MEKKPSRNELEEVGEVLPTGDIDGLHGFGELATLDNLGGDS